MEVALILLAVALLRTVEEVITTLKRLTTLRLIMQVRGSQSMSRLELSINASKDSIKVRIH